MKKYGFVFMVLFFISAVACLANLQIAAADIPFSFMAEGKTYPAGKYMFSVSENEEALFIRSQNPGKAEGIVPVLTRLAPRDQNNVSIVFDVTGKDHYLSEIHLPGQDGFLFTATKGKHTHVIVNAPKSTS